MVIRIDKVTHSVVDVVLPVDARETLLGDWVSCCPVAKPCREHAGRLWWSVGTHCGFVIRTKGRPKGGKVTCIACIARAT